MPAARQANPKIAARNNAIMLSSCSFLATRIATYLFVIARSHRARIRPTSWLAKANSEISLLAFVAGQAFRRDKPPSVHRNPGEFDYLAPFLGLVG
jgi:hypothetical protein